VLTNESVSAINADIASDKLKVIRKGGRVYVPGSEIVRICSLETAPMEGRSNRGRWRDKRRGDAEGT
jgi:hypothetical protein